MKKKIPLLIINCINLINSFKAKKYRFILALLSGVLLTPLQQIRSEEIFLKCTGKYEINRGALIKPDWVTSYLTINLDGLISTIDEEGIKKEGRTMIRGNSYTITHRDNRNSAKNTYKINGTHGTYTFKSSKNNRILIGTCQKGRG
tara:strand:- start:132 stop:569 length:438 start_codon:yes stop_codon:yes gene_type:complete